MRTGIRILALAAALLLPGVAAADVPAACQKAVARGGAKFARAALKISQRCAMHAARGGAACRPDAGNRALDAAIGRAAGRLNARVSDRCAGADLSGFATGCSAGSGPLALADLVTCLRDTHLARVADMVAIEFPALAPRTAKVGECPSGQTCTCRCEASPSGAFLMPLTEGAF